MNNEMNEGALFERYTTNETTMFSTLSQISNGIFLSLPTLSN